MVVLNKLHNYLLLLNLEISLGKDLLGLEATTVCDQIDLPKLFSQESLRLETIEILATIGFSISEFQQEFNARKTEYADELELVVELLAQNKYKNTIEKILKVGSGKIQATHYVSNIFSCSTVTINDIEIPIFFLGTIDGKKIKIPEI